MKLHKTWLILVIVALMALWGCSDDDDTPTNPGQTDFEKMAEAGAAYINGPDCPGVVTAESVHDNLDEYTVIDIRRENDYLAGHIPGAYNSSLATLIDDLEDIPSDKAYLVVCYSGQSAGHAKIAMELLGYSPVYSLGFGMSSWNGALDRWTSNCGDNLAEPEQENQNGNLTEHDYPDIAGSVSERVAAMLANGFQSVSYASIQDNLDDYFIVNYFGEADYLGEGTAGVPGHIPGAYQFTPKASLAMDQMLNNLPTDMPIVVYCWTGQHSSQVTAYLNMLGYEAYSLSFGSNGLFYSDLLEHKWSASADYELETGAMPSETFETIATALGDYLNGPDCPGVVSGQWVQDNLAELTVIDIRQQDDYDAGHIPGAYHSSLSTLVNDLETTIPDDYAYVVVCYTGQSAGHAKIAMEVLGYGDVYSLGFGMCGWTASLTSRWDDNVGDNLADPEQENQNGNLIGHEYPDMTAGTTVADVVDAMLAGGFQGISYASIQDNLEEYFIVNYFGEADYLGEGTAGVPGHIPGAYQFTPKASLGLGQMLANLPTDMPIVVYCWTGQHSSQVTAYLNMLGYEAYSLVYGSNNLFHSQLTDHNWTGNETVRPLEP